MEAIIRHGRTVEEAVESAAKELGVDASRLEIEVLDEGSRGFLGVLGHRESRVRVRVNTDKVELVREILETMLFHIDPDVEVSVESGEQFIEARVDGEDLGLVIGRRGETLNAMQYLVNIIAGRKSQERRSVVLDAGDFRLRRREDLQRLTRRMADRAVETGRRVRLDPMPPHERRIAHLVLRDDDRVETYSEGTDPSRFVVIDPRR
ncbi:MAG: RNA-binding cell elongation regulator Jag/EloR [Clostridia bacterium]